MPTTSCPGTYGSEIHGWSPAAACVSEPHTPASTDRTSTSPAPGCGASAFTTSIRPVETTTRRIPPEELCCAVMGDLSMPRSGGRDPKGRRGGCSGRPPPPYRSRLLWNDGRQQLDL